MYADNYFNHHPCPPPNDFIFVLSAAVIIAGRPATGKSSALSTVVSTLNAIQGSASSNVKLVKIYPDSYIQKPLGALWVCVLTRGRMGGWNIHQCFQKSTQGKATIYAKAIH